MKGKKLATLASAVFICSLLLGSIVCHAQFGTFTKEDLIKFTPEWTGERYPDGRPKVPDDIIERMKWTETEEAWAGCRRAGYNYQFEPTYMGGWFNMHPERVVVGRAVTATYIPRRPDVSKVTVEIGKELTGSQAGGQNSWIIDKLIEDDVMVVNIFGKVIDGPLVGGNLANSVWKKTGGTGIIVDGGVRDLGQIYRLPPDFNVLMRGAHPSSSIIGDLAGINIPTTIGEAICMPGDVVLLTIEGVVFIPPHLAEGIVESSESTRLRDNFGFIRLHEGKYTPGQIDSRWSDEIQKDFIQWMKDNVNNFDLHHVPSQRIEEVIQDTTERMSKGR
ncbi:RraA family protein [Candidatus Latescibacterota bacterium]